MYFRYRIPGCRCPVRDYEFNGTTTVTWPWYGEDITEKFTDESKVLFKYGTGLKKDGTSIKAEGTAKIGEKPAQE